LKFLEQPRTGLCELSHKKQQSVKIGRLWCLKE